MTNGISCLLALLVELGQIFFLNPEEDVVVNPLRDGANAFCMKKFCASSS